MRGLWFTWRRVAPTPCVPCLSLQAHACRLAAFPQARHISNTARDDATGLEASTRSSATPAVVDDDEAISTRWHANRGGAPTPGLYLVATPIGNLGDITLRALQVLGACSLVLAEDTRHTRKLLHYHGISAETMSYHAWNEREREQLLIQRLRGGEVVALVSDAGTPAISDPGQALVTAAVKAGVAVVPIPGPCALIAAIVASGLSTNSFMFCGFLSPKPGPRKKKLEELRLVPATLAFYVPPHSLKATLHDMATVLGPTRQCCVAREMTKVYEEFFRATLKEAADEFERREARGEIVLLVDGFVQSAEQQQHDADVSEVLRGLLESGTPVPLAVRETMEAVGTRVGASRKDVYSIALDMKRGMRGERGE